MQEYLPSPMFFEVYAHGDYVLTVEASIPNGIVYLEAVSIIRQSGGIEVLKKLNNAGISARKFIPDAIELYPEED